MMREFRFFSKLTLQNLGKLCQQRMLLAGVALLCFFLPLLLGPVAESVLSQGISFPGVTLAITAPEGDPVPEQLARVLPNMNDVSQYCQVRAMGLQEALACLERGEVTAILSLPENFIQGILNGTNPDVELIVRGDRPLESLLTFWIGQSASDMLAAFQSGIYAVLELYQENPPDGLTYQQAVGQINLRYVNWMMNRQSMFRTQMVSATDQLSVGIHYCLSLLAYLMLSLAPFFMTIFDVNWVRCQRRFRAIGHGTGAFYGAALTACWIVIFTLLSIAQLALFKGNIGSILLSSGLCALFCAAFGSFCCLLTADTGSCGLLSFGSSLAFLALSGGILPPVLLPPALRAMLPCWPVTWLRNMMAISAGESNLQIKTVLILMVSSILLMIAGWLLYRRRSKMEVTSL